MKQVIKIASAVLFLSQIIMAQDTSTTIFEFYQGQGNDQKVIKLNPESKDLIAVPKNTNSNSYLNAFIIIPAKDNPNQVYLLSAKQNNLYLCKMGENKLGFKEFEENNRNLYSWEIQYAGFPYALIKDPLSNERRVIRLIGDKLELYTVPNDQWGLLNNNDPRGNSYRFKMEQIKNTL